VQIAARHTSHEIEGVDSCVQPTATKRGRRCDMAKHSNRIDLRIGPALKATRCLTGSGRTHRWLRLWRLGVIS